MSDYLDFLAHKAITADEHGPQVDADLMHPYLFEWQRRIVAWALHVGRAAIWADTGLGKTLMQVEWARQIAGDNGTALIVAPLAVCYQTVREARKINVHATYIRDQADMTRPGVWVTSYEMIENFNPGDLDAVVLDEASILKNSSGKTRNAMIAHFQTVPYRLACTATPAPNDPEELTNQAEFLGQMTRTLMLAAYFVHDQDGWRLKGHARRPMIRWMSSWAVAIRKPSDMGGDDTGYDLPGLNIVGHTVEADVKEDGALFAVDLGGVQGRANVRKQTLDARCRKCADLIAAEPDEPWLIWTGLNDEADTIARLIPDAVNVKGSMSPDEKARALLDFADGTIPYLITKPSIASQGLNYQHCARMVFVGLSDSYEQYYQAIRRCYRYGQARVVDVHIVTSRLEGQIVANVRRKELQSATLTGELVACMKESKEKAA
ncbi:DEAD/DEAH box helicase [Schaalia cardiffensis]|uniref:helicase-related protein n=1 Tax=Schaalia cardiffensis TaxID=181487 RepID=UPI0023F58BCE|nr:DEAD/DEAH box helicase [Schaalia cardiffensis]